MRLAHRTGVSYLDPTKTPGESSAGVTTFWLGCQFLDLEGTVRLVFRTDSEAGDASFIQASSPVSRMFTVLLFLSVVCALGQGESWPEFVVWAVGLPGHLMAEDIASCQ